MPNKFKYNKTGTEANSIFKGLWAIDTTSNNIGDGPSSATGFYNGANIPSGGYTIYNAGKVFAAANDTELLGKLNSLGANAASASAALAWAAGQTNTVVLNQPFENILTSGLVLNFDASNVSSFINGEPTTNLIPNPTVNSYPTTGNGWGTYNTNQYCGNNGCAVYWDIPAIASVSDNIVTTVSAHQIRSFDVINPQTSGGGLTGGTQYLAKKISDTKFSLHAYNGSQDGSQGYLNPATGRFKVHDSFYLDQRISVNASSFPTKWFGNPHQPNSALVKEIISGGFNVYGMPVTDCVRLHWFRSDATDGMAYGVDAPLTPGIPVTVSFYARAASPSAVGQSISFQNYNYSGPAGYSYFSMGVSWGAQGVWVRNSYTFTPTHNAIISYWFPSSGDMKVDIANIQVEQNTGLTPFVAGSRSQNTTMYDLSGNNKNGTLTNGPTITTDGLATGYRAISFDGIDDYISFPNPLNQVNADQVWTVSAWVNLRDGAGGQQYILQGLNNGIAADWYNNGPLLYLNSGANDYYTYGSGYIGGTGWNNLVYVFDNKKDIRQIYKNGNLIGDHAGPNNTSTPSGQSATWTLGQMQGHISILQVYNKVLSEPEIVRNFELQRNRFGI